MGEDGVINQEQPAAKNEAMQGKILTTEQWFDILPEDREVWADDFPLMAEYAEYVSNGMAIAFAEWLPRHAQPITINQNWILNLDKKEYTTEQLYEIFLTNKNQTNGK